MRTSVGSVACRPLLGSTWMKSLAGRALPDGLVEHAVERDALAFVHALGRDGPPLDGGLGRLLVAGERGTGQRAERGAQRYPER
jgi:hypothetical protein